MTRKDPYNIVKSLHVTEKSRVLQELKNAESNPCVGRCESPKYVFIVDKKANKQEIAKAVQEMYQEENIRVTSVNTILLKPKKRRLRGKLGKRPARKKAIVTLQKGDSIENV